MAVTTRSRVVIWAGAAGRCAFPDCRKILVHRAEDATRSILLGEIAHMVAQKQDGPRGDQEIPGGEVDGIENLMLLCQEHHSIIDAQPLQYPVAKLLQIKKDHEHWVATQLSSEEQYSGVATPTKLVEETVYSTLLPVHHVPRFVHVAPCSFKESEVTANIVHEAGVVAPFIVNGGNLMTFCDLEDEYGPFGKVIDPFETEKHHAEKWWEDPDQNRLYVQILNRALNKLTGRLGLNLDKQHKRYYFEPKDGDTHSVNYKSIGGSRTSRNVAWQPTFRSTGEKKNYWEHLAVGLRFQQTSSDTWCLSIRPERRFTRDGKQPLTPKGTGRRSNNRKSHMYNLDVLTEVHFWRDFLSNGTPRIILKFGSQSVVIGSEIVSTEILWPEITGDTKTRLKAIYEDDLFSLADYNEALEFDDDDSLSLDEEEDT